MSQHLSRNTKKEMMSNERKSNLPNIGSLQLSNQPSLERNKNDDIQPAPLRKTVGTMRLETALNLLPTSFHGTNYEDYELFLKQCEFAMTSVNEKSKNRLLLAIKFRLQGRVKQAIKNVSIESWDQLKKILKNLVTPKIGVDDLYLALNTCKKRSDEDVLTYSKRLEKIQNDILAHELNGKSMEAANALMVNIKAKTIQMFIEELGVNKKLIRSTNPQTLKLATELACHVERTKHFVDESGKNREQFEFDEKFNFDHFFCLHNRLVNYFKVGICRCQVCIKTVFEMIVLANNYTDDDSGSIYPFCELCGSSEHTTDLCIPLVTFSVFSDRPTPAISKGPSLQSGHEFCVPMSPKGELLRNAVGHHFVKVFTDSLIPQWFPLNLYLRMPNEVAPMFLELEGPRELQQTNANSMPKYLLKQHPSRYSEHFIYLPASPDDGCPLQWAKYHFVRVAMIDDMQSGFLNNLYLRIPNNSPPKSTANNGDACLSHQPRQF